VYNPDDEIVPTVEFPPETPLTLQATAVFDVPVTVAVSCCALPSNTLELEDATLTVTDWSGGVDEELFGEQLTMNTKRATEQTSARKAIACAQIDEERGDLRVGFMMCSERK
jgi:hypothetical protein